MNALGVLLVGGIVRGTAFAIFGVSLAILLRKRVPSIGGLVALSTLSGLVAVSALSIGPGPTLWQLNLPETPIPQARAVSSPGPEPIHATVAKPIPRQESWLILFAHELRQQWNKASTPATTAEAALTVDGPAEAEAWRWPAWLALAILGVTLFGVSRLVLALVAVRRLRKESVLIDKAFLRDEIDILCAEMSLAKPLEVRVSDALTTPATIGWIRPVVLLPYDWENWPEADRKAVLAHELAHIQRNDYAIGVWGQLCLALHAYHPLAHWLMNRLRLEQELAADASGAALAGGRRPYLESLARLALQQSEPRAAWPVRPFLPTRGTFLRRIEMLRDPKALETQPPSVKARALAIVMLGAVAIALAGLRGPAASLAIAGSTGNLEADPSAEVRLASQDAKAGPLADLFDMSKMPVEVTAVIAGRPPELLKRPSFAPIVKAMKERRSGPGNLNLAVDEVAEAVVLFKDRNLAEGPQLYEAPTMITKTSKPQDWKAVAGTFVGDPESVEYQGATYVHAKGTTNQVVYATIGDTILITGQEENVKALLDAQKGDAVPHLWDEAWSKVKDKPWTIAAVGNTRAIAGMVLPPGSPHNNVLAVIGPLFTDTKAYAARFKVLDKGVDAEACAITLSEEATQRVEETATAAIVMAKNGIGQQREKLKQGNQQRALTEAQLLGSVESLLKQAKVAAKGYEVTVAMKSSLDIDGLVQVLYPAIDASRAAAKRSQSMNNLKQIGLAMHTYVSATPNAAFPGSAMLRSGSKFPYSWRVALLPYLEEKALYDEYDFNEPWDSPKNLKLVAKMPAVYAHPSADRTKGFSSYYVINGPSTLFPTGSEGIGMAQVTDGTSNTIMTVESKQDTPWTKPEDIVFDPLAKPENARPKITPYQDGGFNAGFADGSVRFIKMAVDTAVLRALISRNGGEVVSADAF